ncbi:MAG: hypothetical protein PGN13_09260 [Patulibacter minatonensis]
MLALTSRRTVAVLGCSLLIGGVAGCGSGDDSGTGTAGGGSSSSDDGRALLNDAFKKLTPDGGPLTSLTTTLSVSGKASLPKDEDIHGLDGKVALTISGEKLDQKTGTPPVKVTFDVDGSYTDTKDKTHAGKYAGGFSYLNDELFVNWKGKDYAFGKELTKQFAAGFTQGLKSEAGDTKELEDISKDPGKLYSTLDLQPGTWVEDTKVEDGPELDGVATQAVSGKVDVKAVATDFQEGFKKLPAAFPNVPSFKEFKSLSTISDADVKEAEDSLTTRDLTVWVGKDDHIVRRLKLDIAGKDDSATDPIDVDLSIQIDLGKINQPQGITAPKTSAPVTDLFAELQKDFPGIGALLGG